jgi:O-antigen/teichoic acid export membrane protein
MTGIWRAFVVSSVERYLTIALNFIILVVVSRLMTPAEIGVVTIGMFILGTAQSAREFGMTAYLANQKTLPEHVVRSAFTLSSILTLGLAAAMVLGAGTLAAFYQSDVLRPFMYVSALTLVAGTFYAPLASLLQRDLEFSTLATIHVTAAAVNAGLIVLLVMAGVGAMSFALAGCAQSAVCLAFGLMVRRQWWVFRPSFDRAAWHDYFSFGGYSSLTFLLARINEALPSLVLGRMLNVQSVGYLSRAGMVCDLPLKGLLTGVAPVALSAFAYETRTGGDLKSAYLRALSFITVVQWPCLILLALLAHPVVSVLMGDQWLSIVPLVQVIAIATLSTFPVQLTYPVLASTGQIRPAMICGAISLMFNAVVLVFAGSHSVQAAAYSLVLTQGFQNAVAVYMVRRQLPFAWTEFGAAVAKSAIVAVCSGAAALSVMAVLGLRLDMSVATGVAAGVVGVVGGLAGVWLTGHPAKGGCEHVWHLLRSTSSQPFVLRAPTLASVRLPRLPAIRRPRPPAFRMPHWPAVQLPRLPAIRRPRLPAFRMPQWPAVQLPRFPATPRQWPAVQPVPMRPATQGNPSATQPARTTDARCPLRNNAVSPPTCMFCQCDRRHEQPRQRPGVLHVE